MEDGGDGCMYKHKMEKDIRCPLEYGLEVFGGKCVNVNEKVSQSLTKF